MHIKSSYKNIAFCILCSFSFLLVHAQHTLSSTNPERCNGTSGSITISNCEPNERYTVMFSKDSVAQAPRALTATSDGTLLLAGLASGEYSGINLIRHNANGAPEALSQSVSLIDKCIGSQTIKFLGTGYSNFVGIKDDNPTGFAQFYGMLSVPVRRKLGLSPRSDTTIFKRSVWLRNVLTQVTYGNTDKFKLWSLDTIGSRYVNRLDLLAHSYVNANLTVNVLTILWPLRINRRNVDESFHTYIDAFTSLYVTEVWDSVYKVDTTARATNVKSPVYGINIKNAFSEGRWRFELAIRRFWVYPSTNAFNTRMNPQYVDRNVLADPVNEGKPFTMNEKKVKGYSQIEMTISYNPTGNTKKNDSNIFLRYNYVSNSPSIVSKRYANNYVQFQLGYSVDVTSFFPAKKSS